MSTRASVPAVRKHIFVCLLLLAALLSVTVAASVHMHQKQDLHDQCALCMTYTQMIAVCVVVAMGFLLALETKELVFRLESDSLNGWVSPAQWVRPPPIA